MVVSPAGDETEALLLKFIRQRFGVREYATLVVFKVFAQRLAEGDGLGGDDVHERAALHSRKELLVQFGGVLRAAEYEASARAAQGLVCSRRNVVGVRDGRRVYARGDGARDVRDVGHDARAYPSRYLAD